MKRSRENRQTDSPSPKRQALGRTNTIELIEEDKKPKITRRTSSVLGSLESEVCGQLSAESRTKLEHSISSILTPGTSFQAVRVSSIRQNRKEINSFLPSEIWIIIFKHLIDRDKWKLATTCKRFFAIFESWVGFDAMIIYHTDKLRSTTENVKPIMQGTTEKSSDFRFFELSPPNLIEDIRLVTGQKNAKGIGWRRHYELRRNNRALHVFSNEKNPDGVPKVIDDEYNPRIAIIPMNIESDNRFFPVEFLPCSKEFSGLFGTLYDPGISLPNERFLSASWTIYPDYRCEFLFLLNSQGIKNVLHAGEKLSNNEKQAILMTVKHNALKSFRLLNWRETNNFAILPACQPSGFKDLELHEYQLRALAWMKNIETHAYKKKYLLSTLIHVPAISAHINTKFKVTQPREGILNILQEKRNAAGPWFVDERNWDCSITNSDEEKYQDSFMSEGGILADEMGLGKTISVISLILSHPRTRNESGEYETKHPEIETMYETGATLVVCPSQLVSQWKSEIQNRTSLSVLDFTTITTVKKCNYQTLLDADVVIVPHSLLVTNKQYLKRYTNSTPALRSLESKNVTFHHIGWHRIVIDEAHEILSSTNSEGVHVGNGEDLWKKYSSNYRWYVTGTPLPRGRASFVGLANFLNITMDSGEGFYEEWEENAPFEWLVANAVQKCLLWRNTKQDVESQVDIPPLTESIEFLQFSSIEQSLHDAALVIDSTTEQRQICSFPLRSKLFPSDNIPKSLAESPKIMVDHYQQQIENALRLIPTAKEKLQEEEISLADATAECEEAKKNPVPKADYSWDNPEPYREYHKYKQKFVDLRKCEDAVYRRRTLIENYEGNIVVWSSQLACFMRLFPSEEEDPCGICDNIISNRATTSCKHSFCSVCISSHVRKHQNCPVCKKQELLEKIEFSGSTDINSLEIIHNAGDSWKDRIIQIYGSKMAAIASHLRELITKDELVKVIVFSQYGDILSSLSELLREYDPENFDKKIVDCRGNIHARKKQLELFNSETCDSPRVLLLSLANSASGTHLAVATHIILVDPVVGSKEEAQATDAQAIARAHRLGQDKPVIAVRFIVENSIDQSDYEQTYGTY